MQGTTAEKMTLLAAFLSAPALPLAAQTPFGQTAGRVSNQPAFQASSPTGQAVTKRRAAATPVEVPAPSPAPAAPVQINLLQQPASPATVQQRNGGLTVKANNSSLSDILRQVASATGMRLEGLGGDERVFGNFGPAAAPEVLTALLNGTHYNVMMVGQLPNGAPRQLVLMRKPTGSAASAQAEPAQQDVAQQPNADEEDQGASEEPDYPQPMPSIEPVQLARPGVPEPTPPGQPVIPPQAQRGRPGPPDEHQQQQDPSGQAPVQTPQQLLQQIQQQQQQQPQEQQQEQEQQQFPPDQQQGNPPE